MKNTILFLALLCCAATATELLQNGDFKQPGKNAAIANGWQGAYVRLAEGDSFIVQCIKGAKSGYCEACSLPFDVKPNTDFVLTGEHKGASAILYAFFILSDGKTQSVLGGTKDDANWTGFKVKGKVPANAKQCRVLLRTFSGQTPALFRNVHFDGVLPNPECSIPNGVSLLENGSFEQTNGKETDATRWRGVFIRTDEMAREGKFSAKCLRKGKSYCEANSSMLSYYAKKWVTSGRKIADFPLDREKIAADMRRIWLQDTDYIRPDRVAYVRNTKGSQISYMENMGITTKEIPDPPNSKGHTVVHFAPSNLTLYNNPNMSLIKDPDAREGCAFQVLCTPRPNYFTLPLEAGCYDTAAAKTTLKNFWKQVPEKRGFQWMYMGRHTMHMKYYVYLTGSWEIQASMGQYLEFGAKTLDIWCRMKFEGPQFYPADQGKTNRIVVDSISFVEI